MIMEIGNIINTQKIISFNVFRISFSTIGNSPLLNGCFVATYSRAVGKSKLAFFSLQEYRNCLFDQKYINSEERPIIE